MKALIIVTLLTISSFAYAENISPSRWIINTLKIQQNDKSLTLRSGFFRESDLVPFRGNIIGLRR
jgi:hypothetical protein